ncbi:MAG: hypothetical protein Q8W46_07800 [Candidatus Palauibacterales bacterium]|nr:hypothetical protein [Candidatus Palauibacterales bacterium]
MNWEYLHLVTHPFAIVMPIVGSAVGLVGWASGRDELERYGLISLLIAAAAAVPSYITGISTADDVAARTFVEPGLVQDHRTWATWAAIALVTCGIFAGFSIAQPKDRRLRRFVLLMGALAACLVGYAAFRGGKIVHGAEERVSGAVVVSPAALPLSPLETS